MKATIAAQDKRIAELEQKMEALSTRCEELLAKGQSGQMETNLGPALVERVVAVEGRCGKTEEKMDKMEEAIKRINKAD